MRVGDLIRFDGALYVIKRIDRHVWPICLGSGLRITSEMAEVVLRRRT